MRSDGGALDWTAGASDASTLVTCFLETSLAAWRALSAQGVPALSEEGSAVDPLDALYRDVVLEHYRRPRNRKPLDRPDTSARVHNPLCGDQVQVELRLEAGCVAEVSARARGCSITVAAGSVMAELVRGRSAEQAKGLATALERVVRGEPAPPELDERLRAFACVAELPARERCALLPWEALREALDAIPPSTLRR